MRLLPLLFAGLLLLVPLGPAFAQFAGALSSGQAAEGAGAETSQSTAEAADARLQELIDTLQDPEAREQLIGNLQALLEANRQQGEPAPPEDEKTFGATALEAVVGGMSGLSNQLVEAASTFAELPGELVEGIESLERPEVQRRFLEVAATLLAIAVGGLLVEFLIGRLLARPRRTLDDKPAESWAVRLLYLLLRLLLDLVPIAAFAATTYGILTLADTTRTTDLVALTFINANVLDRAVRLAGRLVLVPQNRGQRLLPIEDETAHYLYLWLRRLSFVGIYGFMATQMALAGWAATAPRRGPWAACAHGSRKSGTSWRSSTSRAAG
jgi:small conductance mechanosensitive channel